MESGSCSWLSGRNDFVAVNFLQYFVGAALPEFLRNRRTEARGFCGWPGLDLTENLASIRPANHGAQPQFAANILRVRADGYLAAASETPQQRSLTLNCLSRREVVQKLQSPQNLRVAAPRLDGQRALANRGTHQLRRNLIAHIVVQSQPPHPTCTQNKCPVFAAVNLPHPGIHLAAQRNNLQ